MVESCASANDVESVTAGGQLSCAGEYDGDRLDSLVHLQ